MPNVLLEVIHRAASIGWVYDSIQFLAGATITRRRLQRYLTSCRGRVLDIGGGTGALAGLLPKGCTCTCLDNEMPKLQRCAEKAIANALLADATLMPIQSDSIDVVTCVMVTHHLTDGQLDEVLGKPARRHRRPGGQPLVDAVGHLGRGGAGEGQAQDARRVGAVEHQRQQSIGKHLCLAGAGRGGDPDRFIGPQSAALGLFGGILDRAHGSPAVSSSRSRWA